MIPTLSSFRLLAALSISLALTACFGTKSEPAPPPEPAEVTALIAALRSNDPAVRATAAAGASKVGLEALPLLRTKALIPALPDQVRSVGLAYRSFSSAALTPGNEALRARVAAGFLDAIEASTAPLPDSLRDELLRQLALVANDPASIARIGKLLERAETRDGARRALEAISHPAADSVLITAMSSANTAFKPEIARTLGRKRTLSAVAPLVSLAGSNDPHAASAARYALARIGDAQSREILVQALDPTKPATFDDLLEFADTRAHAKDLATAESLYAKLLSAGAPHHRAAAAFGLAKVENELTVPVKENIDLLIRALSDDDAAVRFAAEKALGTLQSFGSVALLRQTLWEGEVSLRPALLRILVNTDPQLEELLTAGLHDPSPEVRAEAMRLSAKTASDSRIAEFVEIAREETGVERDGAIAASLDAIEARLDAGNSQDAARWLGLVASARPTGDAARKLTRLAVRVGDPAALEWLVELDAGDDSARAQLSLANRLGEREPSIAQLAVEKAYLSAKSNSVRAKALESLLKLGGDPRSLLRRAGFLADWHILGPLPRATDADFEATPFTTDVDLSATHEGKVGPVQWHRLDAMGFDGIVDLEKLLDPDDDCSAYGYCEFDAEGGPAQVLAGSDDGCAIWLNGALLYGKNIDRGVHVDDDKVDVTLNPGKNTLLIKVNQGNGGFGFCVRVVPGHAANPDAETR